MRQIALAAPAPIKNAGIARSIAPKIRPIPCRLSPFTVVWARFSFMILLASRTMSLSLVDRALSSTMK